MDKASVLTSHIDFDSNCLQVSREISNLSIRVQILSIHLSTIFILFNFFGHQICLAFYLLFLSLQTFHLRRLFLQLMSEFLQPHELSGPP